MFRVKLINLFGADRENKFVRSGVLRRNRSLIDLSFRAIKVEDIYGSVVVEEGRRDVECVFREMRK